MANVKISCTFTYGITAKTYRGGHRIEGPASVYEEVLEKCGWDEHTRGTATK